MIMYVVILYVMRSEESQFDRLTEESIDKQRLVIVNTGFSDYHSSIRDDARKAQQTHLKHDVTA